MDLIDGPEEMLDLDRQICILKNIRNSMSKAKSRRTANCTLVSEYFGYGAGYSYKKCKQLGISATAYTVVRL